MSQENVEVVRASFDLWNTGEMRSYGELLDPDVIARPPPRWPEPGPFVGREAVLRELELIRNAWDADVAEPIGEFVDTGNRVAVRWVWRGRGRGPAANMEMSCVLAVRNGKVLSMDFFWDHAEALEAAGLSE